MTIRKALHPIYKIDKMYVSRKKKGKRGLTSIADCVDASEQGLVDNIKKN